MGESFQRLIATTIHGHQRTVRKSEKVPGGSIPVTNLTLTAITVIAAVTKDLNGMLFQYRST